MKSNQRTYIFTVKETVQRIISYLLIAIGT